MVAEYAVHFREPWQGAPMDGHFNRWVDNKDEAMQYKFYYEVKYRQLYDDEYAKVELVSVR